MARALTLIWQVHADLQLIVANCHTYNTARGINLDLEGVAKQLVAQVDPSTPNPRTRQPSLVTRHPPPVTLPPVTRHPSPPPEAVA
eukprot:5791891-Prymnesium_polylepis.1